MWENDSDLSTWEIADRLTEEYLTLVYRYGSNTRTPEQKAEIADVCDRLVRAHEDLADFHRTRAGQLRD